ncbi:hypothetical protein B1H10_05490 [candidate division KSB1 bacterium 4484_188]|nr:MAG: hypothetical protein B1H10_05490 [candidate division KSB1 bacterium 4484_188]
MTNNKMQRTQGSCNQQEFESNLLFIMFTSCNLIFISGRYSADQNYTNLIKNKKFYTKYQAFFFFTYKKSIKSRIIINDRYKNQRSGFCNTKLFAANISFPVGFVQQTA